MRLFRLRLFRAPGRGDVDRYAVASVTQRQRYPYAREQERCASATGRLMFVAAGSEQARQMPLVEACYPEFLSRRLKASNNPIKQ
jgi:hypothetical protein